MNSLLLRAALLLGCLSMGCSAIVSNELDGKPSSNEPGQDASPPPADAAAEDASADAQTEDQSAAEHQEDTSTEEAGQDAKTDPDVAQDPDVAEEPDAAEAEVAEADAADALEVDAPEADALDADAAEADAPEADADAEADAPACPGCAPGLCCGNVCCPGTSCASNSCSTTCVLPYLNCNGNIVDGCEVNAATDPDNCGACGNTCVFGAQCMGGMCVCPPGTADCDGIASNGCEADLAGDPLHCGGCLKTCAAHQDCALSLCKCASGFADCDNQPGNGCEVDTVSNELHCGACGNVCSFNETCAQSACECVTGFLDCDAQPGCEATATSVSTCGACNVQCVIPAPLCGPSGCTNVCPGGKTLCSTSCIDTTDDPLNCGGCALAVGSHQHCTASQIVCDDGWGDCDGLASTGCEEMLSTDTHCGTCTTVCKPGAVCSAGTCACAASTPLDCGPNCAACCNDTQCADSDPCTADTCSNGVCASAACSQKCCVGGCFQCCVTSDCGGGVQTCSGGLCIAGCDTGKTACNGTCVDMTTDPLNCGGCGRACLKGRTCGASKCTPAWVPLPATLQPAARQWACGVWTGTKMFVWGGRTPGTTTDLNTGGLYDPAADAWTTTSTTTVPFARSMATCVWTGSVVVVWGGGQPGFNAFTSGGRFDPATNTWLAMAPPATGRFSPVAVWTGSRVLVWGGSASTGAGLKSGGLYDPVGNTWAAMSTGTAPVPTLGLAAAWAGGTDGLIVFGGEEQNGTVYQDVYQYLPATDKWVKVFTPTNVAKRSHAFAAWVNSKLFIWGGQDAANNPLSDGGYIDIVAKTYTPLPAVAPGTGRAIVPFESGWLARSGSSLFLMGGVSGATYAQGSYLLDTTSSTWSTIPAWSPAGEHRRGVGAWSGNEFIVWGGLNGAAAEMDGSRWLP